jgi:hypothetical protein
MKKFIFPITDTHSSSECSQKSFYEMSEIPKSHVLSFDVGKVNMAYCVMEVDNNKVSRPVTLKVWKLINFTEGDPDASLEIVSSKCVSWLNTTFDLFMSNILNDNKNTWIMIERQRPINPDAFALSYTLFSFFLTKYKFANVSFVSPNSKPIESTGRKRKSASVAKVNEILDTFLQNERNVQLISWFRMQPKKDDLADCFLQIMGNIKNITVSHNTDPNVIVIDD